MPIECLISFTNNPHGVYFAGQELAGTVDLSLDTTKRIRCIHITVNGFAKIRWIKKGYPKESQRGICRAFKPYLSSRSYVAGNSSANSIVDLLAGEYTYTFHVLLPKNIPTSFDGKYGQIHYEIVACIERPGRYVKNFHLPFTMIQPIDLNINPIYKVPLEIFDEGRFWSFCCPTGPLLVKFNSIYSGFTPGQKINFVLFIDNKSSVDFTEVLVRLKQEVRYECNMPQHEYRSEKIQIFSRQFGNVLRFCRKKYKGSFHLPSIPPTCLIQDCPITIKYYIKVVIKPTSFHNKFKMKIPITIGTVPILDNPYELVRTLTPITLTNEQQQQQFRESRVVVASIDSDGPPEYIPMILPSYQEAIALSKKFIDDIENELNEINESKMNQFKPRYPVYDSHLEEEEDVSDLSNI